MCGHYNLAFKYAAGPAVNRSVYKRNYIRTKTDVNINTPNTLLLIQTDT